MSQGIDTTKRFRSANYNSEEKLCLLKLVSDYKHVIECKKTDLVTCQEKDRSWKEIQAKFNARSPNNIYRNVESLKKYYENIKNKTRKQAAQDRMENILNGGGCKDTAISSDPILTLLNKKNVYGLNNSYDSDSIPCSESNVDTSGSTATPLPTEEILIKDENNDLDVQNIPDEPNDTSLAVKQIAVNNDITSMLEVPSATGPIWEPYKATNLQTPHTLEDKRSESSSSWKKRRRPAVPTSAGSSQLSKQYSDLANVKLEIAELQKHFLQEEEKNKKKYNEREAALRMHSLQLEIDIKKMQLKRETQETHFREQLWKLEIQIKEQQLKKLESLKILL